MNDSDKTFLYRGRPTLPPSEAGFDYKEATFGVYGYENIARWGGECLLKFYPDDGTLWGNQDTDIEKVISVAEVHFAKLTELGMNVPKHSRHIGRHPKNGSLVLYTVSPEIEGRTVRELDGKDVEASSKLLRAQVFEPLIAYYEWVRSNDATEYLSDLVVPNQYVYGHPKDGSDPLDKIWLVDLKSAVESDPNLYLESNSFGTFIEEVEGMQAEDIERLQAFMQSMRQPH